MDAKDLLQGLMEPSGRGGALSTGTRRPGAVRVDGAQRALSHREIASPAGEAHNFTGVMKKVLTSRPDRPAPDAAVPSGVPSPASEPARRSVQPGPSDGVPGGARGQTAPSPAAPERPGTDAPQIAGGTAAADTAVLEMDGAQGAPVPEGAPVAEPEVSEEEVLEELEMLFGKLREFLTLQVSGSLGAQSQSVLASLQQSFSSLSPGAMQALQSAAAGVVPGQAGVPGEIALLASHVLEMLGLALAHVGTAPHGDALSTFAARFPGEPASGEASASAPEDASATRVPVETRGTPQVPVGEADADWASMSLEDGGAGAQGTRLELPASSGPGAILASVTVQGAAAPPSQGSVGTENLLGGASAREGVSEGRVAKDAAGIRPAERALPEVVERIVRAVHVTLREGASEMRLRLNPPQLGSLRVDLRVADGVLTGRLQTESAAAQMAVSSQIEQLKSALAEQGITVGAWEVSLAPDARASAGSEGGGERRGADGSAREGGPSEGIEGAPADWREERMRFGLSRFERVG